MDKLTEEALMTMAQDATARAQRAEAALAACQASEARLREALKQVAWRVGPVIGERLPQQGVANAREMRETLEVVFQLQRAALAAPAPNAERGAALLRDDARAAALRAAVDAAGPLLLRGAYTEALSILLDAAVTDSKALGEYNDVPPH